MLYFVSICSIYMQYAITAKNHVPSHQQLPKDSKGFLFFRNVTSICSDCLPVEFCYRKQGIHAANNLPNNKIRREAI